MQIQLFHPPGRFSRHIENNNMDDEHTLASIHRTQVNCYLAISLKPDGPASSNVIRFLVKGNNNWTLVCYK